MAIQPFAAWMPHKTAARAIPRHFRGLLENTRFTVAYENRKDFPETGSGLFLTAPYPTSKIR